MRILDPDVLRKVMMPRRAELRKSWSGRNYEFVVSNKPSHSTLHLFRACIPRKLFGIFDRRSMGKEWGHPTAREDEWGCRRPYEWDEIGPQA